MKNLRIKLLSIVLLILLSPTAVFADFTVRVVYDDLIIREGPGTNYAVSRKHPGTYTGVGIFTITEVQPGPGATKGWGRLKSGAGWVSMDWVEKTAEENKNTNQNSSKSQLVAELEKKALEEFYREKEAKKKVAEANSKINQNKPKSRLFAQLEEEYNREKEAKKKAAEASSKINQNKPKSRLFAQLEEEYNREKETRNKAAGTNNINSTKELEEKLKEYEIRLKELQDENSDLKKKNSENQEKLAEFQSKKDDVLKIIHGLKENVPIKGKE